MIDETTEIRGVFDDHPAANADYRRFLVELSFLDKIGGGIPSNPKTIEGWLRTNMGISDEEELQEFTFRTLTELGYEPHTMTYQAIEEAAKEAALGLHANVFKRDEHGLFIEGRQVFAALKEATEILYKGVKWGRRPGKQGSPIDAYVGKAASAFFPERVHIVESRIYLGRDEPDDLELVIVHPRDPSRSSSMHYQQVVVRPIVHFHVEELVDHEVPSNRVPDDAWPRIFRLAQNNGIGARRSQQMGKFKVTRFEEVEN
jgi:hypothetical protein